MARLHLDREVATGALEDAVDRRQGERRVGGVAGGAVGGRLEDAGERIGVDPVPGVAHRHGHVTVGLDGGQHARVSGGHLEVGGPQPEPAPVGHRVEGVGDEASDHLLQGHAGSPRAPQVLCQIHFELDVGAGEALQPRLEAPHYLVRIEAAQYRRPDPADRLAAFGTGLGHHRRQLRSLDLGRDAAGHEVEQVLLCRHEAFASGLGAREAQHAVDFTAHRDRRTEIGLEPERGARRVLGPARIADARNRDRALRRDDAPTEGLTAREDRTPFDRVILTRPNRDDLTAIFVHSRDDADLQPEVAASDLEQPAEPSVQVAPRFDGELAQGAHRLHAVPVQRLDPVALGADVGDGAEDQQAQCAGE